MKTEITIKNLQKRTPISPSKIKQAVKKILRLERVKTANLSIVFVTDRKIKALNKKYLKREHATDVLAFDLREKPAPKTITGEIIISADTAVKNSRTFKTSIKKELLLYLAHGILHLLGFDDHKKKDIVRIRKKEEQLLKAILQ